MSVPKVTLVGAEECLDKFPGRYRKMIKVIETLGFKIPFDWVEAYEKYKKGEIKDVGIPLIFYIEKYRGDIYRSFFDPVELADMIVAEVTFQSSIAGLQIAHAIREGIPVLCMYDEGVCKNAERAQKAIGVIKSIPTSLIISSPYNEKNMRTVLTRLLKEGEKKVLNVRFNCMLNRSLQEFVKKESEKRGVSMSEFIREVLRERRGADG